MNTKISNGNISIHSNSNYERNNWQFNRCPLDVNPYLGNLNTRILVLTLTSIYAHGNHFNRTRLTTVRHKLPKKFIMVRLSNTFAVECLSMIQFTNSRYLNRTNQ